MSASEAIQYVTVAIPLSGSVDFDSDPTAEFFVGQPDSMKKKNETSHAIYTEPYMHMAIQQKLRGNICWRTYVSDSRGMVLGKTKLFYQTVRQHCHLKLGLQGRGRRCSFTTGTAVGVLNLNSTSLLMYKHQCIR